MNYDTRTGFPVDQSMDARNSYKSSTGTLSLDFWFEAVVAQSTLKLSNI